MASTKSATKTATKGATGATATIEPLKPPTFTVRVDRAALLKGIERVKGAVATKNTLPVLGHIKFGYNPRTPSDRAGGCRPYVELEATNLEAGAYTVVDEVIDTEFTPHTEAWSICLPAKMFYESLKNAAGKDVTFTLSERTLTVELGFSGGRAALKGMSADEFPIVPADAMVPDNLVGWLHEEWIRDIAHVAVAASVDDSRPVLASVYMSTDEGQTSVDEGVGVVQFAAADGFRLHRVQRQGNVFANFKLLVPRNSATLLGVLRGPASVYVTPSGNQVFFRDSTGTYLTSRLIEGNYVDIQRVIPTEHETLATVPLKPFYDALLQCRTFAKDSANIVRLEVTRDMGTLTDDGDAHLTLSANAAEVGDNMRSLAVRLEGEEGKVALNVRYLLDIVTYLVRKDKEGSVRLAIKTPGSPAVLRYGPEDDTFVIMPMYLANR